MAASSARKVDFPPPRSELAGRLAEADQILDAAMRGTERTVPAGHVLVREGELHDTVYRLTRGEVARVKSLEDGRRQIICIFTPGDLLAVKSMLLDRQPADIAALSSATVTSIGYGNALALAGEHPNIGLRYMWQLAEDERRLHNIVILLGQGTALERISAVLLDLQARLMLLEDGSARITMTQQELADYVGLTPVHVNRTLGSLRKQGAVATQNGAILLRDLAALYGYAKPMLDIFERETAAFGGR